MILGFVTIIVLLLATVILLRVIVDIVSGRALADRRWEAMKEAEDPPEIGSASVRGDTIFFRLRRKR